jgi:predicted dehydrogenase
MSLRIAYIGAGGFTNYFMFPQLARHEVHLAAVCDLDETKALAAQKRYGFNSIYTDFTKMLDAERPDAVFCVGGPKVHYEVGREVLERGFPLYVQKPPAPSSKAVREMAQIAAKKDIICHVGFNLRAAPAALQAKRILVEAEFGRPLLGIFRYGLASTPSIPFNVMDQHCHLVDTARYLLGEIESVKALFTGNSEGRDYVVAIRFESGAVGSLNFTSGQPFEKEFLFFEITGEGSFLSSHGFERLTWIRSLEHPWWKAPKADLVYTHGAYGFDVALEMYGYIGDVDNFLGAVKGEQPDLCPIADTERTIAVSEEILAQIGFAQA